MRQGEDYPDFQNAISLNDRRAVVDGVARPENAFDHFPGGQTLPGDAFLDEFFQVFFGGKDNQRADAVAGKFVNALKR